MYCSNIVLTLRHELGGHMCIWIEAMVMYWAIVFVELESSG
jgi:hypothetical protein